jgi:hypothetical protein
LSSDWGHSQRRKFVCTFEGEEKEGANRECEGVQQRERGLLWLSAFALSRRESVPKGERRRKGEMMTKQLEDKEKKEEQEEGCFSLGRLV